MAKGLGLRDPFYLFGYGLPYVVRLLPRGGIGGRRGTWVCPFFLCCYTRPKKETEVLSVENIPTTRYQVYPSFLGLLVPQTKPPKTHLSFRAG